MIKKDAYDLTVFFSNHLWNIDVLLSRVEPDVSQDMSLLYGSHCPQELPAGMMIEIVSVFFYFVNFRLPDGKRQTTPTSLASGWTCLPRDAVKQTIDINCCHHGRAAQGRTHR